MYRVVLLFYPMLVFSRSLLPHISDRLLGTSLSSARRECHLTALPPLRTAYPDIHSSLREILAFNDALPRFKELNTAVFGKKIVLVLPLEVSYTSVKEFPPTPSSPISPGQSNHAKRVALGLISSFLLLQTGIPIFRVITAFYWKTRGFRYVACSSLIQREF